MGDVVCATPIRLRLRAAELSSCPGNRVGGPLWPASLALAVVLLPAASVQPSLGEATSMPDRGIVAHRGAATTHPENTLAAINEAIRLGAHQIEVDVWQTADDALILMHDETLTRTTNIASVFPERRFDPISTFTLAELKELDAGSWKGPAYAGETIPTLAESLAALPPDVWLNLDLKPESHQLGFDVATAVFAARREHQAFVSVRSAATESGARAAAVAADRDIVLNNMIRPATAEEYISQTVDGDYKFLQFLTGRLAPTDQHIEVLDANGVYSNYCCTNSPNTLRDWFARGIRFPLVDDVATGIAVARQFGIMPRGAPVSGEVPLTPLQVHTAIDLGDNTGFDNVGDATNDRLTKQRGSVGESDTSNNNAVTRLIVKFGLPNVPDAGRVLNRATLRFFLEDIEGRPAGPVSLFHSTADNDVVASPADYQDASYRDTRLDLVHSTAPRQAYYELDVTDLVREDYATDGTFPRIAFRLQVDRAHFVEDNQGHRYRFTMPGSEVNPPQLVFAFVPEPATSVHLINGLITVFLYPRRRRAGPQRRVPSGCPSQ